MSEHDHHRQSGSRSRNRHARANARPANPAHGMDAAVARKNFFPVWAPLLVMTAVIITGVVLGQANSEVPFAFFMIFAVAAVACALLVEPRGLFLTVAALPLYFLIGTAVVGWFTAGATAANSKKTKLITSIYPTVDNFLWLLIPFALAVGIGMFRWWNYRESLSRAQARAALARRQRADAERRNRESYSRVRNRTVAEERAAAAERAPETSRPHWSEQQRSEAQAANPIPRTRTVEELRASAQRRRMPLPERRSAPRHYLNKLNDTER